MQLVNTFTAITPVVVFASISYEIKSESAKKSLTRQIARLSRVCCFQRFDCFPAGRAHSRLIFVSSLTVISAFQGHDQRRRLPGEPMLKAAGTAVSVVRLPRVREPRVGLRRPPALHPHKRRGLATVMVSWLSTQQNMTSFSDEIDTLLLPSLAPISN